MSPAAQRLKAGRLLAYGLPGLPLAALTLPVTLYLPTVYADDVGIGLATVGAVILAARIWDVITDPLVGALSDRFETRWGRRKPWILGGLPLLMLSVWLLFRPPEGAGWVFLLVWTMALYLADTLIRLPYSAWGAELSADYHERSRIAAPREAFVVLGLVMAVSLPAVVGGGAGNALAALAVLLVVLLPLTLVAACSIVAEPRGLHIEPLPWRRSFAVLAGNGPFLRVITAYFLNGIANGLPATLFLLFVEHRLGLVEWQGPLLLIYFLCGLAAVPLWLKLSFRFGKHRVWSWAMIGACLVFVCVPLLGPGDLVGFIIICVLTGFGLGADLVLPPSIQADVIDLDRLRSGSDRAGLYFALWGMATKLALALAVGIAFPLLEFSGFDTAATAQPEPALDTLVALYSLAPVAFKLTSIALIWRFPITQDMQARIRRLIARKSAPKATGATP